MTHFLFLFFKTVLFILHKNSSSLFLLSSHSPQLPTSFPHTLFRENKASHVESTKPITRLEAGKRSSTLYLGWARYTFIVHGHQKGSSFTRVKYLFHWQWPNKLPMSHNCHPHSEDLIQTYVCSLDVSLESVTTN